MDEELEAATLALNLGGRPVYTRIDFFTGAEEGTRRVTGRRPWRRSHELRQRRSAGSSLGAGTPELPLTELEVHHLQPLAGSGCCQKTTLRTHRHGRGPVGVVGPPATPTWRTRNAGDKGVDKLMAKREVLWTNPPTPPSWSVRFRGHR